MRLSPVLAILLLCLPFAAAAEPQDIISPPEPQEIIYWDERSALEKLLSIFPFSTPKAAWETNAVPFAAEGDKPLIALVIDDMGLDRGKAAEAVALPGPVTLAYLPYARHVREQAAEARAAGHELMVHMPMQPRRATADPGPDFLSGTLPHDELKRRITANLAAFDGYAGVNNHMGSRFTCCAPKGLDVLMRELKSRGLLFLDSVTTGASRAEDAAAAHDIPASHRDIFIDDEETNVFTEDALHHIESFARKHGTVIAIGHPRRITLDALKAWIPTLEEKGFQLAPLSAVIRRRMEEGAEKAKLAAKAESAPVEGGVQ